MLLVFLSAGDQVEDTRQDEDCGALSQASDDAKDKSQVVNENCRQAHYREVCEADQVVQPAGQLILWFNFAPNGLA